MTSKVKFKSDAFAVIHSVAHGVSRAGTIDKATMRGFDESCLAPADRTAPAMPRFAQNTVGRDFAVGDIHGCFTELQRGLDAIGFDPTADRLFSVGDLVDRGPESHLALRWLAKPWFHAICGNHDFMAWRHAIGQPYEEVDHLQHGGAWVLMLSDAQRQEFGARLAALPLVLEVETGQGVVGLVHADCPYDDWLEMGRVPWHNTEAVSAVIDCCLWSIDRYARRYAGHVKNVRAVVHGHTTTRTMEILGNVHFIDTGGWRPGGHFTFLDLQTLVARQGPVNAAPVPSRRNR